jgi:two-component system chemotaxis sensor kinase CheA
MEFNEEYLDLFFDEVNTSLDSLNQQLIYLEKEPDNKGIVQEIFRIVHTVKGMAATVGFNSVAKLCHKMEELFDYYRKNPQAVHKQTLQCELKSLDSLFKILEYISSSGEEQSICKTLAEAIGKEIDDEINRLQKPAEKEVQATPIQQQAIPSQRSSDKKQLEVTVHFVEDCTMPGVRAFMTTQVLEKNGEVLLSNPAPEHFLDSMDILSTGLVTIINSSKSIEQIRDRLLKISDVASVEVCEKNPSEHISKKEDLPPSIQSVEEGSELSFIENFQELEKYLTHEKKTEILQGSLKAFQVHLVLAEDVDNPKEQFFNLLTNLNEYLGHIIYSIPTLHELLKEKDEEPILQNISSIIDSTLSGYEGNPSSSGQKLYFVLLINGTHKNILDFLSDACELNKVEVKEIEAPVSSPELNLDLSNLQETLVELEAAKKSATEENKDLSFSKSGDVKTAFARVNMATLESLMNSVGELVINHNRVKLALGENTNTEMRSTLQYLNQVTTKIQQLVMSIRMVPVNQVFSRFPRFIRDISRELKKEVDLEVEGENTEIDRLMIDELNEIFTHLVRNAIDHGIETADEREKNGKPRKGSIKMQAHTQGNNVLISISDDGRGMDPHKIKMKAIQKGMLNPEQAELMNNEQVLDLVFATGFSTAENVSDLSGRGVGMDVVKSKVSGLGGQIVISSLNNEGTSVRLSIPSTISIIQALLITSHEGLYAIPLSEIKEIVYINLKENIYALGSCPIVRLHNETVPIINLNKYLEKNSTQDKDLFKVENCLIVIVISENKNFGLIVDSLVGQQEIVIKPISNKANLEGLINGATVFGDGRVAMILNIDQVIKHYLQDVDPRELSWGNLLDGTSNELDEGLFYWASNN